MIRRYGRSFLDRFGPQLIPTQRKVLAVLAACRTAAMGARTYRCDHCGQTVSLYNSCGDRHCPQCQARQRAEWLDKRREELLPVEYFHAVFTVPQELTAIAAAHPKTFYTLLFRAARETLLEVAASPQHLGAEIGGLADLAEAGRFAHWLSALYRTDWVVYVEPPEDREPEQILKYLARYTYRVAISNDRIESIDDGRVTFWYRDYARGGRWDRMTLVAEEFLRRLVQHVLPPGFVRIRSFGFLANCHRAKKLTLVRRLLAWEEIRSSLSPDPTEERGPSCPHCGQAALRLISQTPRPSLRDLVAETYQPKPLDSS